MAAAQAGDQTSYVRLLREIALYARHVARRHHASPHLLDDVVQDVLLTVHRIRHTYDPSRPFSPWITAIAYRRSIDALRQRLRRASIETSSALAYGAYADPVATKQLTTAEERTSIEKAIISLPPRQRQAVELLKLREVSLAEAAEATGQSTGALKVSLHRALRSLRQNLLPE
jgi:RNA polymerase sigma-70 factor (ECF subfamily)